MATEPDVEIPPSSAPAAPLRAGGATAPEPAAERVGIVTGTRLCIRCGFNLTGQTIVREPAYALLIARCPECGTVAPLQEYPPLGAWQRRWMVLLAVLWFAGVLALGIATAMLPRSLAIGIAWRQAVANSAHISEAWAPTIKDAMNAVRADDGSADALSPGMLTLAQQYATWYNSEEYSEDQIDLWIQQGSIPLEEQWWDANKARVLATAPVANWDWVRKEHLQVWLTRWLACFGLGALWSAILFHHRLRNRLVAGTIITACAALVLWMGKPEPFGAWSGGWAWGSYYGQGSAWNIAFACLWTQTAAICLLVVAVPFFLGLIFGRPLVRLLARALLPPRACQAIAPLWFCDGKEPPRVRPPRYSEARP